MIKRISDKSLKTRVLVAAILVPLFALFIILGGLPFMIFFCLVVVLADWEFWRMFRVAGYSPSLAVIVIFTIAIFVLRSYSPMEHVGVWLSALVLVSLTAAVIQQAKDVPGATLNFAFTIGGTLYIGWLGSYLILLRNLPNGMIWTIMVIFAAAMSDAGGYLFGSLWGKHKMAPAISPKKSWEGYVGGIIVGGLSTGLVVWGLHAFFPDLYAWQGLAVGFVLSATVPIGDLAESMFKRQFQIKDASHILPGHGGILDRIDSSLWGVVIGYYLIILLTM